MVRTRIAPSPTGNLHVGTARTALFNYLFAKREGGAFVLRIEDTDLERSTKAYEKDIFDSLRWLGIEADESPEKGGPFGPYRQSERIDSYKKYLSILLDAGLAFYCFHSEDELERERKELFEAQKPPVHICEYRAMTRSEQDILVEAKGRAIIRFKVPLGKTITFSDLIRGEIRFDSDLLGDFSLAKSLTTPLYNFAVVVDDHDMEITHVIRGEDHIPNTPKQIFIIEALGFLRPHYAHLPLILGPDRAKLSKRHGAMSVDEYRKAGYLPEALFNFVALLGWSPGGDREIITKTELLNTFSLERVQKSGAVFDVAKLEWMNSEYIRRKSVTELAELCLPHIVDFLQFPVPHDQFPREYVERIIALEQPRLAKLSEIGEKAEYFFRDPTYPKELLRWKEMTDEEIIMALECAEKVIAGISFPAAPADIEKAFFAEIGGGDKGTVLWPLRVALTGKKGSPGPFEILAILGRDVSLRRIAAAKDLCRRR